MNITSFVAKRRRPQGLWNDDDLVYVMDTHR